MEEASISKSLTKSNKKCARKKIRKTKVGGSIMTISTDHRLEVPAFMMVEGLVQEETVYYDHSILNSLMNKKSF